MKRAFHAILRSALVAGATTGGSPCGDPCSMAPESRYVYPLFPKDGGTALDAAADAIAAEDAGDAAVSDADAPDAYASYFLPDGALDCPKACPARAQGTLDCRPAPLADAAPGVECIEGPHPVCSGSGRAHAAVTTFSTTGDDVGAWLAAAAFGEAGSVLAFRRLHAEYKRIGAPRTLLRRLSRAARDEARHARAVRSLARAEGAAPASPPRLRAVPSRGLEALALENAVEGCVIETYGAVLVAWQAANASDARVRAVFGRIARDEARHAELAWSLARFAEPRLSVTARDRVEAVRRRAFDRLRREAAHPAPALVARGLAPTAAVAGAMVTALEAALGSGRSATAPRQRFASTNART